MIAFTILLHREVIGSSLVALSGNLLVNYYLCVLYNFQGRLEKVLKEKKISRQMTSVTVVHSEVTKTTDKLDIPS